MRSNVTLVKPPFRPFLFLVAFILLATTSFSQVLFSTSFEGTNPWAGMTNNQSCCSHSVTASTDHPHDGLKSFRSEVKTDDPAVSAGYRAELTFPSIDDDGDMWYGWSMYFDPNNAALNDWTGCCGHVVQWHPESSGGGAVLDLRADGGKFDFCVNPAGGGSTTHQPGTLKDIVPGRWYDIVMHVVWSSGSDGKLEVWIDGALYYSRQVSWTIGRYFKFGMNRWTMTNTWVVYYDNLKIGRNVTYNDVAPTPVTPGNQSPTVDAGNNSTITLPATATLTGTATDPDGNIASTNWTWVSGPTQYNIQTPGSTTTVVSNLLAGTYVFRLTATDNAGASANDQVTVIVNPTTPPPPVNQPPVARAGTDITITLPISEAEVNGSGSTDADGNILSQTWAWVSGPTTYSITNASALRTMITGLVQGTYTFRLTVRDDDAATSTDDIRIIVNPATPPPPPPNQPPVARAGTDITITLPINEVEVNSGTSTDADGNIAGQTWSWVSGPTTYSITTATAARTMITGLVAGTYTFRVTVRDDDAATATDDIRVIVNPAAPPPPPPPPPANRGPVANAGNTIIITLPTNTATLYGTGSTDPDGLITAYEWVQLSGPSIAGINNARNANIALSNLMIGEYMYQLKVTDNAGASATATVKVIVQNKNGEQLICSIYPNPTRSELHINYIGNGVGKARIVLYDANQHYVLGETVPKDQVLMSKTIDLSKFRSGIYILEITIEGKRTIVKKIIKL
jgi:hypothetical protein